MTTAIKDFQIKESYFKLIEKALFSYLWEGIYKPMFEIFNLKPTKARNAVGDVITEALRSGDVYYSDGAFRARKRFTNAQSLMLKQWGALYDKYYKVWRLPLDKIPIDIRAYLAQIEVAQSQKMAELNAFLAEVQANMPYIIDTMVFDTEVITILDDAGKEVQKNVKHLNIITPELSEQQKQEIARAYTENVRGYVIKDFAEERIPEMRQKIQELVLSGARRIDVQKMLEKEYGFMANKAKFLARNETAIMLSEYKKVTYQEMGFDRFIWRTITDGKERELHKQLNGKVFSYDNPPIIDERTGQRGLPGQTYNCLTGDMKIISPYIHFRLFKRQFRGELTELVLPMGRLKVTSNHPILTDKGWIPANLIKVGDKIAKISHKTFTATGADPNNIKVTIEEFFSFYSMLFDMKRVSHSDLDFHGDISVDNQVDVINIESKLRDYFKTNINKSRVQDILTKADKFIIGNTSDRTFYQAFPFGCSPSHGLVSSLSKLFSFFFSSKFHAVDHGLGAIAWLDTLLFEVCGYNTTRNPEFFRKLFNTPTFGVEFYRLLLWEICFNLLDKNVVPSLLHCNREVSRATAETLGNFRQVQTAFVEFDTVIDKIISKSFLHIYNLENSNNWYITENYITKNCRCTQIPTRQKL